MWVLIVLGNYWAAKLVISSEIFQCHVALCKQGYVHFAEANYQFLMQYGEATAKW